MDNAFICIGDVHGQRALLEQALDWIAEDDARDLPIVFLGDYVDRGPDSKGVIDLVMDLCNSRDVTCLLGNHEAEMLRFLDVREMTMPVTETGKYWLAEGGGGRHTLQSYGIHGNKDHDFQSLQAQALAVIPQAHLDFLTSLPRSYGAGEYFFAHAGIRPGVKFGDQDAEDLIWIREPFLSDRRDHGKLVVHGHTPINFPAFYGNRVNCDGGAAFGRAVRPVILQDAACFALGPTGRIALPKQT